MHTPVSRTCHSRVRTRGGRAGGRTRCDIGMHRPADDDLIREHQHGTGVRIPCRRGHRRESTHIRGEGGGHRGTATHRQTLANRMRPRAWRARGCRARQSLHCVLHIPATSQTHIPPVSRRHFGHTAWGHSHQSFFQLLQGVRGVPLRAHPPQGGLINTARELRARGGLTSIRAGQAVCGRLSNTITCRPYGCGGPTRESPRSTAQHTLVPSRSQQGWPRSPRGPRGRRCERRARTSAPRPSGSVA